MNWIIQLEEKPNEWTLYIETKTKKAALKYLRACRESYPASNFRLCKVTPYGN